MPTQKKIDSVERLAEQFAQSSVIIATDYRGLSVSEMFELRGQLREKDIQYRVVKNTLASFAAERAGKPGLSQLLRGPTALALSSGEATELAKAITQYWRSAKTALSIRGGLLEGQVLTAEQVIALSTMPSREVLLGQLLGLLQTPAASFQRMLSAGTRQLLALFQARIEQLGGTQHVD